MWFGGQTQHKQVPGLQENNKKRVEAEYVNVTEVSLSKFGTFSIISICETSYFKPFFSCRPTQCTRNSERTDRADLLLQKYLQFTIYNLPWSQFSEDGM